MNTGLFEKVRNELYNHRESILNDPTKARTAGSDDRLSNLKRIARATDQTTDQVVMILASKHWVDLCDMANGTHHRAGDLDYFTELICDVANYLDLLYAVIKEPVLELTYMPS